MRTKDNVDVNDHHCLRSVYYGRGLGVRGLWPFTIKTAARRCSITILCHVHAHHNQPSVLVYVGHRTTRLVSVGVE